MKARFVLAFLALALGMAGCSSLPLPDDPDQSLLVIPQKLTFHVGPNSVGTISVSIVMTRREDGKVLEVPVRGSQAYTAVALDPGSYTIQRIVAQRGWRGNSGSLDNTWKDERGLGSGYTFFITGKIVRLYELSLIVSDSGFDSGDWDALFFDPGQGSQKKSEIFAGMKDDPHWPGWEGYQLINFEDSPSQ